MNKRLLAALMVIGTMAAPIHLAPSAQAAAGATDLVCDNSRAHPYTGTYTNVTVPAGASCFLRNALVTGNFKALHGAKNVYIINTEVQRNIHIRRATRTVKIGTAGCKADPPVGNNLKVTRSHNVVICFMTVDNNIRITRNDGRITLRDSVAGQNIQVVNNLAYNRKPGDGRHRKINAIRLFDNEAGRHIVVKRNAGRPLILRGNSPVPIT